MGILREKTSNRMAYIELAVVLFISAYYIMPAVNSMISPIMAVMMGLAYLAFVFMVDPPIRSRMLLMLSAIVLLAFFYTVLTDTETISDTVSNYKFKQFFSKLFQYLTMYFPVLLFIRVHQLADKKQRFILLSVCFIMIVYVALSTLRILAEDASATRSWGNENDYQGENLGGYYFVYAVPILIAILAGCFVKMRIVAKCFSILTIGFFLVFLINAQYTLAILITVIGIIYQIFKSIKEPLVKLLFFVAVVLLCMFIPNILEFAIQHIPSEEIVVRLREIYNFLTGGGADGYNLSNRLELYWKSIVAFFNSPIWGNRVLGFDGHATFLTVLARTGILGGIPFYWLFFSSRKHLLTLAGDNRELLKPVILMFALMGLTNPIHASQPLAYATWFIAPLAVITIFGEETVKDEKAVEN